MDKVAQDNRVSMYGRQAITACAFLHAMVHGDEKVYLARRAETAHFMPGVFELPGGHIEFDEDIVEGLQREIFEECGLKSNIGDPFFVFTYNNQPKITQSVEVIYFATFEGDQEKIILNSEEHSEYKWLSEGELINTPDEFMALSNKIEFDAILKGFGLLRGESLSF